MENWTFLKDAAARVEITERATQRIVADLLDAGNCYQVNRTLPLRHPVEQQHEIGKLLRLLGELGSAKTQGNRPPT